jgi:hypothetical protein
MDWRDLVTIGLAGVLGMVGGVFGPVGIAAGVLLGAAVGARWGARADRLAAPEGRVSAVESEAAADEDA